MRQQDRFKSSYKLKVEVRGGNIDKALKEYKRKITESGHLLELKDRKEYTKPTTARRKAKKDAIRREQLRVWNEKYGE